jgi:hypothetical protein
VKPAEDFQLLVDRALEKSVKTGAEGARRKLISQAKGQSAEKISFWDILF